MPKIFLFERGSVFKSMEYKKFSDIIFYDSGSMYKSSPLIENPSATPIIRTSKRSNTQRNSNDYQHYPVPNPFLGTPNFLPPALQ